MERGKCSSPRGQRCNPRLWTVRMRVPSYWYTRLKVLYLFYSSLYSNYCAYQSMVGRTKQKQELEPLQQLCISQALLQDSPQIRNQLDHSYRYTTYSHFAQRLQDGFDLRDAYGYSIVGRGNRVPPCLSVIHISSNDSFSCLEVSL